MVAAMAPQWTLRFRHGISGRAMVLTLSADDWPPFCVRFVHPSFVMVFGTTKRWVGVALLGLSAGIHAQTGGPLPQEPVPQPAMMFGDVIDSHDALVPGAKIRAFELTHPTEEKTAIANDAGHWELTGLRPGSWTVFVTAQDLTTFQAPRVSLKPGGHQEIQGVVLTIPEQHSDITVTMTVEQVAEQEMKDQEKQRSLAIFPNFNTSYVWNAAPLTRKQKFRLSMRSTLDPVSFGTAAAVSGYQYGTNKYPEYGNGFEGYAQYYGAAWGTIFIGHTIGYAILPSIFGQDPRYFYMGSGTVKQRAIHAMASSVLARGDSGHTQFNYSHILGNFAAGYISRSYHPGTKNGIGLAVDNTLIGVAGQMGVNLVREFALKRISSGTPKYGRGKPEAEKSSGFHP